MYRDQNDEEGKIVSILDIYKFLTGSKKESKGDLSVVPYDGRNSPPRSSISKDNLASIIENVRQDLKKIWRLNSDQRNKAVKGPGIHCSRMCQIFILFRENCPPHPGDVRHVIA